MITEARPVLSQAGLRAGNAWRVLQAIRAGQVTSRAVIATETGLTPTTVHRLTDDLRRRRLVVAAGMAGKGSAGRPSALFRFNGDAGCVVGIDVGNETTRGLVANLDRRVLTTLSCPTDVLEPDLLGGVERLVAELGQKAGVQPSCLVAVAVGVPAVTEAGGTIVRASMHHPWEGLQLGGQLRRVLGCEVVVAQDDHLAALAELHGGACVGLRNAIVLNMGKGIGAGIIADGEVYYGAHAAAGRLAWIPVPYDGTGGDNLVPLGQMLNADGLIADYRRFGGTAQTTGAVDVFAADASGDAAATRAIDLFADRVGWLLAAAVAVIDPQRIVLGGGISNSFDRFAPRSIQRLGEIVPLVPPVVRSELGTAAVSTGAVDAALQLADEWLLARIG